LALGIITSPIIEEKVIEILDENQKNAIYDFVDNCNTPMQYRLSAMIMLSLQLGFRTVDIFNLKFSNIDWKKEMISIIQVKTGKLLQLSFPKIVGNTLYRYITLGRPSEAKTSPNVFVQHRMPYCEIKYTNLNIQLNKILQSYDCIPIKGFHVLRRTYGTLLLEQSTDFHLIASALGQVSSTSVKPYLSLNEIKMKECSLSLKGIEKEYEDL